MPELRSKPACYFGSILNALAWQLCLKLCRQNMRRSNECYLAVFSLDVAFDYHFVATAHPPPYKSASGIGYVSKNLYKMTEISAM